MQFVVFGRKTQLALHEKLNPEIPVRFVNVMLVKVNPPIEEPREIVTVSS